MKKEIVIGTISVIGGIVINVLGGWDMWLASLIFLICTDIVVGLIKSFLCKSDKSKSGGLNSKHMFRGGIKKMLILVMIAIGTMLDGIIAPDETYIRSVVAGYYIANESLSILENIGACGVPLPKFLFNVLDALKKDNK